MPDDNDKGSEFPDYPEDDDFDPGVTLVRDDETGEYVQVQVPDEDES